MLTVAMFCELGAVILGGKMGGLDGLCVGYTIVVFIEGIVTAPTVLRAAYARTATATGSSAVTPVSVPIPVPANGTGPFARLTGPLTRLTGPIPSLGQGAAMATLAAVATAAAAATRTYARHRHDGVAYRQGPSRLAGASSAPRPTRGHFV